MKVTSDLFDPHCVIRIGRFEIHCKTVMTVFAKTKKVITKLNSETPSNPNSSMIALIVALLTLLLIVCALSAFYCLYKKQNGSKYVCESESISICEATTSIV